MTNSLAPTGRLGEGNRVRTLFLGLALTASLGLVGCVERLLMITSDPTGARITVNGKDLGQTPVTIPFVHNQRFEYRIEKDGYRSVAGEVTTQSTWDSIPGPDFVAENVYPGHIRRETVRNVPLERLPATRSRADLEAIFQHAEAVRMEADTHTGGPDIPPPTRPDRLPAASFVSAS